LGHTGPSGSEAAGVSGALGLELRGRGRTSVYWAQTKTGPESGRESKGKRK
jgi:hypothetical protein